MLGKLFKWTGSYLRLALLRLRFGGRVTLEKGPDGKPTYLGRGVRVSLGKGARLTLGGGVYVSERCQLAASDGASVTIGRHVYLGAYSRLVAREAITVGAFTLFADNVSVYDHNHVYADAAPIETQGFRAAAVTVGENCWLCTNAVVTAGSAIGAHTVVGANAVVLGACEANAVYAGNPAALVKRIGGNA